jgi:hypothetical protein
MVTYKQFISESKTGIHSGYRYYHKTDPTLFATRTSHHSPDMKKPQHDTLTMKRSDKNKYDPHKPEGHQALITHPSENDAAQYLIKQGYVQKGMYHRKMTKNNDNHSENSESINRIGKRSNRG